MLGLAFIGPAVSAAVVSSLGFTALFLLVAATLLLAFVVGRRVLKRQSGVAGQAGDAPLHVRIKAQLRLLRDDTDFRRTMLIDGLAQMSVAYFVVFAIPLAMRRYGLSLQAAAGLITLQGALYVATLFTGGVLVARWRFEQRYLLAFAMLLAQSLLFGFGHAAAALWIGAALMGVGVGLQGVTSTTRFGELMQRHGRGRIGGLSSLAPTPAASRRGGRRRGEPTPGAPRRASAARPGPCSDVRAAGDADARRTVIHRRGLALRWASRRFAWPPPAAPPPTPHAPSGAVHRAHRAGAPARARRRDRWCRLASGS
jgi:hypothetical protein